MKPILRYTLGNVGRNGLLVLAESIRLMKGLYDFEIYICHNNLSDYQLDFIGRLDVNLMEAIPGSLPIEPKVENWKLYPPRIDMNRHEIIIDNDYLLVKRLEELDKFLEDDVFLISEDNDRNLGQFSEFSDYRSGVNSGLYGMPPGYNFQFEIVKLFQECKTISWSPRFDDQGIISCLLATQPHITIPLWKVPFSCSNYRLKEDSYGYHFVEVNRIENHIAWNDYVKRTIPLL